VYHYGTAIKNDRLFLPLYDFQKISKFGGVEKTFTSKAYLTHWLNKNKESSDKYFPKSYMLNSEEDAFRQEFRAIEAESILKTFDGYLTIKTLLALKITEKRLSQHPMNEPLVNDAENEILKMSNCEVIEKTDMLLEQH